MRDGCKLDALFTLCAGRETTQTSVTAGCEVSDAGDGVAAMMVVVVVVLGVHEMLILL